MIFLIQIQTRISTPLFFFCMYLFLSLSLSLSPSPSLSGGRRQWAFFLGSSTSEMYVCNKALKCFSRCAFQQQKKQTGKDLPGLRFNSRFGFVQKATKVLECRSVAWTSTAGSLSNPPSKREHVDTLLRVTTGKQPIVEEGGQGSDLRLQ